MKKAVITISIILLVCFVIVFIANRNNKAFPLVYGSQGEEVEKLQQYLNAQATEDMEQLAVDGIFGPKTQAMLVDILGVSEVTRSLYRKKIKNYV